jgi:hypothetical protein
MSAKYVNFLEQLSNVVSSLDTTEVKAELGDSQNNHRVLTVSQVIRFLNGSGNRRLQTLARRLNTVYGLTRGSIKQVRSEGRSDAIDINEFINFYNSQVIGKGILRPQVSRVL